MKDLSIRDSLIQITGMLHEALLKQHDNERAAKLASIMKKDAEQEVYIAFTGHYSAGKSSLVNHLLHEQILPTSPIPTSANLVVVRKGEQQVQLHTSDGRYAKMSGAYDKEAVQRFCKDGEQIEMVEISGDYKGLVDKVAFIDTPGIDSTDHTHFLSAASILHQADALFYVVHYNHVHSEENVRFIRSIKDQIPNLYFIVNQVDRHDENETAFEHYKQQVVDMLVKEGIDEDHLYFTSVTEKEHPLNEMYRLVEKLKELQILPKASLRAYTEQKIEHLLKEHIEAQKVESKHDDDLYIRLESKRQEVKTLKEELELKANGHQPLEEQMRSEMENILKNANLTPFKMRELAKDYLASKDPSFKMGMLFSKNKTIQEKARRAEAFVEDVTARMKAEVDWHLSEMLKGVIKKEQLGEDLLKQAMSFETAVQEQLLENVIHRGASLSSEYVLQYTKDVGDTLKKVAKRETLQQIEQIIQAMKLSNEQKHQSLTTALEQANHELKTLEQITAEEKKLDDYIHQIWEVWQHGTDQTFDPDWFYAKKELVQHTLFEDKTTQVEQAKQTNQISPKQEEHAHRHLNTAQSIERFEELARILTPLESLKPQRTAFEKRTERLQSKQFTLALFGAFSSGKSSFANALVGRKVLPSSPTPTTATINKLTKPDADHDNETVKVVFKTEEEMLEELQQILGFAISEEKGSTFLLKLERVLKKGKLEQDHLVIVQHFLHAAKIYEQYIDTQVPLYIGIDELKPYVAEEAISCVVKEVTVYLSTPITDKGITIVDTPGASSMNKRHTEMAFQYMKDADALLYLTYYQHSFSKADRSFLRKLGLVKDSFSMDKMFFIINAADLAKDQSELDTVFGYVKNELMKEGIQNPNVHHVSSKEEIEGKPQSPFNRYDLLRKRLDHFIDEELTRDSIELLHFEADTLCETVTKLHATLHQSEDEKVAEKQQIEASFAHVLKQIKETKQSKLISESVKKDVQEQLYHIEQRLSLFANDLLKTSFYPGLQQGNFQENLRQALHEALKDYEFEFVQELKALDIRMDSFMNMYFQEEWTKGLQGKLAENEYFSVQLSAPEGKTQQLKQIEVKADRKPFESQLKKQKSAKTFFEQNGKAELIEELRDELLKLTAKWAEKEKEELFKRYEEIVQTFSSMYEEEAIRQLHEQKQTYLSSLSTDENARMIIQKVYQQSVKWRETLSF
ncbi:dynamin family protein [Bacillus sp. NPDC077027]|uniref:dynamin family protein n=1 Tax=Bacillus sp. NPDC077027 TaxID=3390548 RepID=UPI003CFE19F0